MDMLATALAPAQTAREAMAALVRSLNDPRCYFHPAYDIEVIETHISFVVLAGPFAYKLKKPVNLGFVDYTTLEARQRYCEAEVRINARTAPELYLGVVPITGSVQRPSVGGAGDAIEYAVRMQRFPDEARLERMAASSQLHAAHMDALAGEIARLHDGAQRVAPGMGHGAPEKVLAAALDNFRAIERLEPPRGAASVLPEIRAWTLAEHAAACATMRERQRGGFVRECHGDLHLGNVAWLDERAVIFDAIEFNAEFRWIDVMSDVGFTVMDLHHQGYPDLAARLLNGYLETTEDYAGLAVLRFYMVYRAMVRAKIACIRAHQAGVPPAEAQACRARFASYLELAKELAATKARALVILHGVSGSGKTAVSGALVELLGAVRVRSDVVRKSLHRVAVLAQTGSAWQQGMYDAGATHRTYTELGRRVKVILRAGFPALVDAAFLERSRRMSFRALADAENAAFAIVDCTAPVALLRERVAARSHVAEDASEADLAILGAQLATEEALDAGERAAAISCDTSAAGAKELAAELVAELLARQKREGRCATSTSSTGMPTASARFTS